MAQVTTFPKKFERHFFRDMDKDFLFIWLITFIICNGLTIYLRGLEVPPPTKEELEKYFSTIYRAPEVRATQEVVDTGAGEEVAEVAEEAEEEEEATEERVTEVSEEQRLAIRQAQKEARIAAQERRRQEALNRVGAGAGAVFKSSRRRGAGAGAAEVAELTGGGGGVKDITKMIGMAGDAVTAARVKKAQTGGAIGDDLGDIGIEGLRGLSANELDLLLKDAPVKLNKKSITAKGKGTKSKQRSQSAIGDVVMRNQNQIRYCYAAYKKQDPNLRGRVQLEFTIAPSGEVSRVVFKSSDWTNRKLKRDVEKCIRNVVMSWHFDPIADSEGDVTAGASYTFE